MFLEVQLDKGVSYGAQAGPVYQTLIMMTPSRQESRVQQVSRGYRSYKIMLTDKTQIQMTSLQDMFVAAQGRTNGFRFYDKRDYQATNEPLTNFAGGTTVQLIKTYGTAHGRSEVRPIKKPQQNITPITLKRDGANFATAGNWTIDVTSGIITFSADQTGHVFTWSGEFDTPVRFDTDTMDPTWEAFNRLHWDTVPLLEIAI